MAREAAQSPHDALFKSTFSQLEHARPLLRAAVPPSLAKAADWSTLAVRPGSFVDDALKHRHTDLLFSVSVRGAPVLLYLLFEHQSKADRWMPLRLLEYEVAIWRRHIAKEPRSKALPFVLPIVVHHSKRGWTFGTRFEALFDLESDAGRELLPYLPRFDFLLDDVSHATDEELRGRAVTALAKLVLACFRNSRDPSTLLESLAVWTDVLGQVRRAKHGVHALQRVLRYIYDTSGGLSDRRIRAFLERVEEPALAEEIVTLAQMFENRGIKKGLAKGLAKGLQKGRALTLLRLLEKKFGKVPSRAATRVKAADEATLDRWTDQVLTAGTLAEALA
jgi:hypothetical protein